MSQEITIIVMVDIQAALHDNTLDGNIYLMDNLKKEGSKGIGTGNLISAINGSYWCDGSQTCDIVLNWLITGIGSIPLTLPRNYAEIRTKIIEKKSLQDIKSLYKSNGTETQKSPLKLEGILQNIGNADKIKDDFGNTRDLGIKALNILAEPFESHHDLNTLSYLPPLINKITGEAVDNNILFPAQYGTPVQIKDGWYWSATVNTSKTGIHNYTLHLTLYKYDKEKRTWIPVKMKYDAKINITNEPQVNGFTNAGIGYLPII